MSTTTLSQRFSQLSQTRKPQTQAKVNVRVQQKNQDQRSRRQDLTQQRRGIAPTNDKKRPDKKILPRVKIGNVKKGLRIQDFKLEGQFKMFVISFLGGRPAERRQGKNGKGKGKPDKKKENVTPMDLDMEMDKCKLIFYFILTSN